MHWLLILILNGAQPITVPIAEAPPLTRFESAAPGPPPPVMDGPLLDLNIKPDSGAGGIIGKAIGIEVTVDTHVPAIGQISFGTSELCEEAVAKLKDFAAAAVCVQQDFPLGGGPPP
jgi:hypothetical protein